MPRPLCVDLDGSLLRTDCLVEAWFAGFAERPWAAILCLWTLASGRLQFKNRVAAEFGLPVETLPFRNDVIELCRARRMSGAKVYLVSASPEKWVAQCAAHFGIFDGIRSSTETVNLKGKAKADLLVAEFGAGQFDYLGDSKTDLPVWKCSAVSYLVGRNKLKWLESSVSGKEVVLVSANSFSFRSAIRLLRPHQWVKNLLVFVPLMLAHNFSASLWLTSTLAFVAFCSVASAVYIINDLLDLSSDRSHQSKRNRPLSSGHISIPHGLAMAAALLVLGFAVAIQTGAILTAYLLGYFALTFGYSIWLKSLVFFDVLILAALYTLRILTGGAISGVPVTNWLLMFSFFVFLSLALIKRFAELVDMTGDKALKGRGYLRSDSALVSQIGVSSGLISALVLALYVSNPSITKLYKSPEALWFVCPLTLTWILRMWFLTHRGQMKDDPVLFAVKDRFTYAIFAVCAFIVTLAS